MLGLNNPSDHPDFHAFASGLASPLAVGSSLYDVRSTLWPSLTRVLLPYRHLLDFP